MASFPLLTALPRALSAQGYNPPGYRKLYALAVDGAFPAVQSDSGRWTYSPDDLHTIADALGLSCEQVAA